MSLTMQYSFPDHGAIPSEGDWLNLARPVIEQRMARYQAGEIHFNLMAIVQDKLVRYKEQMLATVKEF